MPLEQDPDYRIRQQLKKTYSQIASHFDVTRYKPWPETIIFSNIIPKESKVLDIGCGNGRNAVYLAKQGHRVTAMDNVSQMVEITRRKADEEGIGQGVYVFEADMTDIPLSEGSMDAVLCIASLHHLPSDELRLKALKDIERVLATGGQALISVWAREQEKYQNHYSQFQMPERPEGDVELPWTRQMDGRKFPRYYHFFTKEEFTSLCNKLDMELLEYYYHADNHYARLKKL